MRFLAFVGELALEGARLSFCLDLCSAKNLKPGQTVKISPEDGGEILHISQVCMSKPVDNNRTYLKVVQGSQSFAACVLQKDKTESCSVDLFLSAREGIQLALEGGKNELSVIGYFEPEPESESDGDNEMAGFGEDSEEESEGVSEDETDGMTAPVVRVGCMRLQHFMRGMSLRLFSYITTICF